MSDTAAPDIAVLASFSGEGGVERMLLNLVNAFATRGYSVHLLLIRRDSPHLREIDQRVRCIPLGRRHTSTSLPPLVRYLRRHRPSRLLVAKDRAGRLAVKARRWAGTDTRLVLRLGTNLSAALQGRSRLQRWLRLAPIRRLYPKLDRIVAVSQGVAEDTIRTAGVPATLASVVRNPVITPDMKRLAMEIPPHPWLQLKTMPVVLGAGRLTRQKDFPTLLQAFAKLVGTRQARLIILGDGGQREELLRLIVSLGLETLVDLPGFSANPYAYMANADLFVLSSRWEGSPNVLTEAMALGTPVVATDCPSGPNEILDRGRIAPLVPMGDWHAMAMAMEQSLRQPPDRRLLRDAVKEYEVERSTTNYLRLLGLPERKSTPDIDVAHPT